ncbi:MAG TPA: hypothetical protein VFY71_06515 [Planctomycetota bacterium]|nr:hypothetical protein [Planctomycetota bacterium]
MAGRSAFRLVKWYLDLVTEEGEVLIGYAADLRWGPLRLRCAATLAGRAPGPFRGATHLLGASLPTERDGVVRWRVGERGPRGEWTRVRAGPQRVLLDGPEGAVRWSCLHASSEARARTARGPELSGRGYVERLELTCPPWRLPIRELRWGRFVAADAALAWIDWRGPQPLRLVLRDGEPVADARVDDDVVTAGDAALRLSDPTTLRDGELGLTALRPLPLLRRALPPAMLGTRETKWLSRGELRRPDGRRARGWAVHELVQFPPA